MWEKSQLYSRTQGVYSNDKKMYIYISFYMHSFLLDIWKLSNQTCTRHNKFCTYRNMQLHNTCVCRRVWMRIRLTLWTTLLFYTARNILLVCIILMVANVHKLLRIRHVESVQPHAHTITFMQKCDIWRVDYVFQCNKEYWFQTTLR